MMTTTIAKSFHHLPSRDDCLPRKTKAVAGKSLKKMTDKTNSAFVSFLTTKKHFLVISQSLELSVGKTRHPRNQHTDCGVEGAQTRGQEATGSGLAEVLSTSITITGPLTGRHTCLS